jgi:CHASE3 domain sensor protein
MTNTLRKIALQIAIPVVCGLILVNMYLVSKNVKVIQRSTAQRAEASEVQARIANVLVDLQDMETGQRGYLMTGDAAYLKPFNEANGRLSADFAALRTKLSGKDSSLEKQLETVATSKIGEMKETISLRERGYRHRAFLIVNSNRGKELMDEARSTLDALSATQNANVTRYEQEMAQSITTTVKESVLASIVLLVVSAVTFLGFHTYRKRLEIGCVRHTAELHAASQKLELYTSSIFHDLRARVEQIRAYAGTLLDVYDGYLPHQGQEKTEHIETEAGQILRLLDDLSDNSGSGDPVKVQDRRHKLSA